MQARRFPAAVPLCASSRQPERPGFLRVQNGFYLCVLHTACLCPGELTSPLTQQIKFNLDSKKLQDAKAQ